MSLTTLQLKVDRAVSNANGYILGLVDKLMFAADVATTSEAPRACDTEESAPLVLPPELLQRVFFFLNIDTLVNTIPLVCKPWKTEVERYGLEKRASRKLLDQVPALANLGPSVSATHLYLAVCGRNLLRNPGFRRECNTQLLELGRQTWNRWQRDAWVVNHTPEHGLSWEPRPAGFISNGGCGAEAPPLPVPYGGGGMRLGERMQQQLRGLLNSLTTLGAAEQPPQHQAKSPGGAEGSEPVPPTCIATTADWCEVMQVVDLDWELQRRGLTDAQAAHLLDSELGLRLSVHVGSRSDSLGQFCVGLVLDEGSPGGAVPQMQSFVMRPGRYSFFSGKIRCAGTDGWQKFEHRVAACPRGFRRAVVLLRGRRSGNQPGTTEPGSEPPPVFCGAKFACAELIFE